MMTHTLVVPGQDASREIERPSNDGLSHFQIMAHLHEKNSLSNGPTSKPY